MHVTMGQCQSWLCTYLVDVDVVGEENAMANSMPAESLSQAQTEDPKVEPLKKLRDTLAC